MMLTKLMYLLLAMTLMSVLCGGDDSIKNKYVVRSTEHQRASRAALQPLGFFGKLAYVSGLVFAQFNETKSAFGQLNDIINDQFSDTATKGPKVEQSTSEPGETTTEKYRISRAEFGKIVNRNLRGLQKLMRIEIADAKNQTQYTKSEYRQQLYDQIKPKGGIHQKRVNLTVTNTI